jgi:autotransporter passenger strand-loop-strand repeat protein
VAIFAGGNADGATIDSGGYETVNAGGVASGTALGGIAYVYGSAVGDRIGSGATEHVEPGGTASDTTLSGGLVNVMSGAIETGALFTFAGGGTLELDDAVGFAGWIAGFAAPDRLGLRDIAFGLATSVNFGEAPSNTSGTLSVSDGTHTARLTLLGHYVTSQFGLAPYAGGGPWSPTRRRPRAQHLAPLRAPISPPPHARTATAAASLCLRCRSTLCTYRPARGAGSAAETSALIRSSTKAPRNRRR